MTPKSMEMDGHWGKDAAERPGVGGRPERGADLLELLAQDRHRAPDLLEDDVGAEHEDPGVPEVAAVGEVACSGPRVRLLDEALDLERLEPRPELLAARCEARADLQVPVAGLRPRRTNADGRDRPPLGELGARGERVAEGGGLPDVVIRREHRHDALRIARRDVERRETDAWRRVPRARLDDEVILRESPQHPPGRGRVRRPAHDVRAILLRERWKARHGGGEQRRVARERQELLRAILARERPEASAGAAGHDHGMDLHRVLQMESSSARMRAVAPQIVSPPMVK
jgi:hypothetical protein